MYLCVSDAFDTLVKYLFMALYVIIPSPNVATVDAGSVKTQKKKNRNTRSFIINT